MDNFHEMLYDSLKRYARPLRQDSRLFVQHLTLEGYVEFNELGKMRITEKGLRLLRELESIKNTERARYVTWAGIGITAVISIAALINSIVS